MATGITGYFDNEGAETGFFTQGSATDDTSPLLQGTLDPLNSGESVYIIRDGRLLGRVNDIDTTNGTWSFQDSGLQDGHTYSYTLWVLNSTGLPTAVSSPYAITLSAGPPPPPPALTLTLEVWDDKGTTTGQVANNGTTDDDTPTLKGTLSAALAADQSLHVFRDGHDLGAVSVNGTNWEYTDGGLLSGNNYTYTVKVMDAAGTVAESDARSITLDMPPLPTQIPTIDQVYDDAEPITGVVSNGMHTNDTMPTLSGSGAAPDSTVNIYDNGEKIGATTADDSGNWTYRPDDTNKLEDGEHSLTVTGVDAMDNESAHSAAVTFTVDTVAPAATARISAISENTNGIEFITSDHTLVVFAAVDQQIASDEKVQISMDNGATWHDAAPVSGNSNTYQYDATGTPLADGTYAFMAQVVDAAGNATVGPRQDVMIDTEPPTTLATIISIAEDTGTSATDFITADNTPLVTATVDEPLGVYQRVQISLDNGATWKDTMLASGRILDDASTWQYDATGTPLADGTYTFQARVVDAANNAGQATSQTVVIDTTPPAAADITINAIAGNDVLDDGEAKSNVTITGTLTKVPADAVSQELVIKVGNTDHIATVNGANWSVTVRGSELAGAVTGIYGSVVAKLTMADVAGNTTNVTEDRSYLLEVKQTPVHVYTVGTAYAGLGYAMTAISDFNGDGYADYLVSAPGSHYGNLLCAGKSVSYLLYGSANGLPNVSNLDNITAAQGIRITSTSTSGVGLQGMTVTDIGDFNGDGRSDVVISSNLNNTTYVLYGQAGSTIQTLDLNKLTAGQGFSVKAACWAPASATGADVNGDGYSDLIVSNLDCGGKAYVIYGHTGAQGNITYTGTTVKGAAAGYTTASGTNGLGTVLSAVGDVNGDGYTDFIATMPGNAASGGKTSGSAYLVFGGPNGVSQPGTTQVNLDKVGSGKITISASNAYEHLGGQAGCGGNTLNADAYKAEFHSVAGLGNIDGSGRGAFAIGSPGASPNNGTTTTAYTCGSVSEGAGAVYVLYGETNWSNITLPSWSSVTKGWSGGSLNGTNGFVIYSSSFANAANGKLAGASDLGFAVGSAGDVNGDGINDFLIGAPAAYNGKGAAYLVFGTPGGLPGASTGAVDLDQLVAAGKVSAAGTTGTAIEYVGTQAMSAAGGGNLGTDVTGGDFSGTGLSGYVFGAWGQNVAKPQTGEVYVYDGIPTFLTQPISNADNAVYYAGNSPAGSMPVKNGVDLIATGAGNNTWVHGIGADTTGTTSTTVQHDAVSGGRGDDHIGIIGTNFTSVNGGTGWDTLVFEGSNIKLNLADMGLRVQGIEQFDLNNQTHTAASDPNDQFSGLTQGNTLELRLSDVMNQMDDAANSQRMTVLGDNTSTVQLDGSGWASSGATQVDGVDFYVWHNSTMSTNTAGDLLIQQGVQVSTGRTGGGPMAAPALLSLSTGPDDQPSVSTDDAGNRVFTSGSGDDTFNLAGGASDTILYKLLTSADATGGNGHDTVNGFTLGTWETTPGADRIDLSDLLQDYKPVADNQTHATADTTVDSGKAADASTTTDTGNTVDSGKPADASAATDTGNTVDSGKTADASATTDTGNTADSGKTADASATADSGKPADSDQLTQYLSVTHDNNNTTVNVDVHGTGNYAPVVTLNGVDVSLETLLANNQIVV